MTIDITKRYAILEDKERMEPVVEIDFISGTMISLVRGFLQNVHLLNSLGNKELVEVTEIEFQQLMGR